MIIKSIKDLEPIIEDCQLNLGLSGRQQYVEFYRGQGLNSYKLVNGIARFNHKPENLSRKEEKLFDKFIAQVKNGKIDFIQEPYYQQQYKYIKEWFFLFQAQHLGLKTRLMDWTGDWKIALLFAVENEKQFGKDGQFWIFICPRENVVNDGNLGAIYNTHPLEIDGSYMINSPFYQDNDNKEFIAEVKRARQHGRFFIQTDEVYLKPLEEQSAFQRYIFKYIIDGNSKKRIKQELNAEGLVIDWTYYRHDENIDYRIKHLNNLIIKKCQVKKRQPPTSVQLKKAG